MPDQPMLKSNGIMLVPVGAAGRHAAQSRDSQVMLWFFAISGMFWPRLFILGFWIFGSTLSDAFSSWAIPVAGFFVAPWTTVGYAFVWSVNSHSVNGWGWVVVGFCALLDLWTWAGVQRGLRRD